MAISQIYSFDNAVNFTLSDTQIDSGEAKLALIPNAGQLFEQDFSSSVGFTYDVAKAEFAAGMVRQKDQTAANSRFAATYSSNQNLIWSNSGGSLTGVSVGSPVVSGGKLVCTGAVSKGVYYVANTSEIESHKFRYTPNYTTGPSTNVNVFSIYNGTDNNDRFHLTNSPSGNNLRITMYSSTGTSVVGVATVIGGAWAPVSGTEYEFEVVLDSVAGTVRIFVDGVLHGTLSPGAWVRGTSASRYYLGASPVFYTAADGSFDDYISFSDAQHTASYTPGYTVAPFIYAGSVVELPPFSYTGIGTIQAVESSTITETGAPRFTVGGFYWDGAAWSMSNGTYAQAASSADTVANLTSLTVTGASMVPVSAIFTDTNTQSSVDLISVTVTGQRYSPTGYIQPAQALQVQSLVNYIEAPDAVFGGNTNLLAVLVVDGALLWWDGAAWVTSNGTIAEANSEAEFSVNFSSLALGSNSSVYVRWLLSTSANTETPSISNATIEYNFGLVEQSVGLCLVTGYVKDISGVAVAGATVSFALTTKSSNYQEAMSNLIYGAVVSTTTDSTGYFEINLIRSSEYELATSYTVTIVKNSITINKNASGVISFTVPDADAKDITSLITAL